MLPLNYAISLRVNECLGNARRYRTHLNFRRARRRCKLSDPSPLHPFKERSQKCVRAFEWCFHGRTQQYRSLNQIGKPTGKLTCVDTTEAVAYDDDPSVGSPIRLAQNVFQSRQRMNRVIRVAPNAAEKNSVVKLAESMAEQAQT